MCVHQSFSTQEMCKYVAIRMQNVNLLYESQSRTFFSDPIVFWEAIPPMRSVKFGCEFRLDVANGSCHSWTLDSKHVLWSYQDKVTHNKGSRGNDKLDQ